MLKTFLCREEWPESTLCFLLFEINNKYWFCLAGSCGRGVLPSFETPEVFFSSLFLQTLEIHLGVHWTQAAWSTLLRVFKGSMTYR